MRRAVVSFCVPKTQAYWMKQAGVALQAGNINEAGAALVRASEGM
jgi:hypothetical protein